MFQSSMRFTFNREVPLQEAEGTLRLARMAVESLYGPERTALEARTTIDRVARQVVVDVTRRVGRTLALVFAGYVRREFGEAAQIEHVAPAVHREAVEAK